MTDTARDRTLEQIHDLMSSMVNENRSWGDIENALADLFIAERDTLADKVDGYVETVNALGRDNSRLQSRLRTEAVDRLRDEWMWRATKAEAKVAAVGALHTGTHMCVGGTWWTDDPNYEGTICHRGLCPTRAALADPTPGGEQPTARS